MICGALLKCRPRRRDDYMDDCRSCELLLRPHHMDVFSIAERAKAKFQDRLFGSQIAE